MQIGLLQQLGCGALTGSRRRGFVYGLPEDVAKRLDFSPVIQHLELFEQFLLQGGRTLLTFAFQYLYAGLIIGNRLL